MSLHTDSWWWAGRPRATSVQLWEVSWWAGQYLWNKSERLWGSFQCPLAPNKKRSFHKVVLKYLEVIWQCWTEVFWSIINISVPLFFSFPFLFSFFFLWLCSLAGTLSLKRTIVMYFFKNIHTGFYLTSSCSNTYLWENCFQCGTGASTSKLWFASLCGFFHLYSILHYSSAIILENASLNSVNWAECICSQIHSKGIPGS